MLCRPRVAQQDKKLIKTVADQISVNGLDCPTAHTAARMLIMGLLQRVER